MKKWVLRVTMGVACLVVVAVVAGYLWLRQDLRKGLPRVSGETTVSGLQEEVRIERDIFGVPHIFARNERDLYFAMGYAMAQDRFWQMEFYRRLGSGRLAEILGPDLVETDRYFRMLTAAGIKRRFSPELSFIPRAFAAGVNAYLKESQDHLPFEFTLLGYRPEPWEEDDFLQVLKAVNWALSSGWEVDLTAAEILKKVGEERLREAFPPWPGNGPLIVPKESKTIAFSADSLFHVADRLGDLTGIAPFSASNSWTVSGKKSVSGKPLLANDTHLPLTTPSFWWEVHAVCPTMDVSGFALPGVPGIGVGHNPWVAWGITNVMVDDVDFFVEKPNPDNPRQYWYKDHWEEMKAVKETIRVKEGKDGRRSVEAEILLTRHGPIVNEPEKTKGEPPISARWAFTEGLQPLKATYLLAKARSTQEVIRALQYLECPSQNVVFAGADGRIGYWCCATVPIRMKGDGLLPVPGWSGEYEWKGYVPFQERPHLLDPPEGFIATANNKVTHDRYPHIIGRYWEPMDRVSRIRQLLTRKEKLALKDFGAIQKDQYCLLASQLVPEMVRVLKKRFIDERAKQAGALLSGWDFFMDTNSPAACLYEVAFVKMLGNIFKDELGEELFLKYIKTVSFPPRALRAMIRRGHSEWFDNVNTPRREDLDDVLEKSLAEAFSEIERLFGDDMDRWGWGRIHRLRFDHVLGKKRPLDRLFNLGPYPVGGNNLTVDKKQYAYHQPFRVYHGASQRMLVDLAHPREALHVLPTGESGHVKSPHYKDQVSFYLKGRYHPCWASPEELKGHLEGTLLLRPRLQ